jgi:hypothetical protein
MHHYKTVKVYQNEDLFKMTQNPNHETINPIIDEEFSKKVEAMDLYETTHENMENKKWSR